MELSITLALILITVMISLTAMNNEKIISDLIFRPPMIQKRKQYYRFITSGFLHADFFHLAFNMITLYFFGRFMEGFFVHHIGKIGYLLFYLSAIAVSEIPSFIKNKNNYSYRSLGASGAVTAILFSFILLAPWETVYVFFFPVPAILFAVTYIGYTIYMNQKGGDYINHSAHLWGAVYGMAFTLLMQPGVLPHFVQQLLHPHFNF